MTINEYINNESDSLSYSFLFKENVNDVAKKEDAHFEFDNYFYRIKAQSITNLPIKNIGLVIYVDAYSDLRDLTENTKFHVYSNKYFFKVTYEKVQINKFSKLFGEKIDIADCFHLEKQKLNLTKTETSPKKNIYNIKPTTSIKEFKNLTDLEKMINSISPNFRMIDIEDNSDLFENYHGDF